MNKLLIGSDDLTSNIVCNEDTYIAIDFDSTSKNIKVNVMDNVKLTVFEVGKRTKNNFIYNLGSNSTLTVNRLVVDNNDEVTINLTGYGSSVILNNSVIAYNDSVSKEIINHIANNTKSKIVNHGINVNDNILTFNINGIVAKEYKETISNQDNRIINLKSGKSKILPNLVVDSNAVDIFHSAYIGSFNKDIIFYLQSRGISEENCNNLLIKGFLIGPMELEDGEKEKFVTIIENI